MKSLVVLLVMLSMSSMFAYSGEDWMEMSDMTFLSNADFQLAEMLQYDEIQDQSTPFNDPESSHTYYEGDMMIKEDDEQKVAMYSAKRWPNGRIPYIMENKFSREERAAIARGIMTLQDRTCITFVPKKESDKDYVWMRRGPGCAAHVGRIGGQQWLFLGKGCYGIETVVHELMHSVGFIHEQSRPDRDAHVMIMWDNIKEGAKRNFRKHTTDYLADHGFPYDLMSVMHYRQYAFSKNKKPTIHARRPVPYLRCRGHECPSDLDVRKINYLYKCKNGKSGFYGTGGQSSKHKYHDKGVNKLGGNEFDNNIMIGEKFYETIPIGEGMDDSDHHHQFEAEYDDHSVGPCFGHQCYPQYDDPDIDRLPYESRQRGLTVRLPPFNDNNINQNYFWFNSMNNW